MTDHEELLMMASVMGNAPDTQNAERFRLALVKITKVNEGYQEMERIAHEALNIKPNGGGERQPLAKP